MSELTLESKASVSLDTVLPAGYLGMFLGGLSTTLYGPALVYIAAETGQTVTSLGVIFALHWTGFFGSTLAVNRIARRFEMRRSALGAALLIALGAFVLTVLPTPLNLAGALLMGFGNGMIEVIFNRLVELLAHDAPAAALTRLHSTWGLGAIAIPLVVVGAVAFGLNWRVGGIAVCVVALIEAVMIWRWHEFTVPHGDDVHWGTLPWRSIAVFVAMFVVYVGVETAVGGWATTFFAQLGQGAIVGSIATSLFFLTFTIGRLLFASGTDKLGFARTVRIGTGLGAAALLLTIVPELALVGFALAGIAFSVVFPTMLAWGSRRHPDIRAQMQSVAIASAGIGGIFIPYLIGVGVGEFGVWTLTPMLVSVALVVCGLTLFERDPGAEGMMMDFPLLIAHIISFGVGFAIVAGTLFSAIETFVLPRSANDPLTSFLFINVSRIFRFFVRRADTYEDRDRIMAFYAPVCLLLLPPMWIFLVLIGYTLMFWGIGFGNLDRALEVSGSSVLTLGFVGVDDVPEYILAFSEAALGLILIALLIAYMPTIYSAFQRREQMVNMLEVRAGTPPTAWALIERYQRIHGFEQLAELWEEMERWFADIEESHTSIAAVVFFRSTQSNRSWINSAGAVLDAAALVRSTVDIPTDARADLCIRAGYLALRRICDFFRMPYNLSPSATDPISITRQEYDRVYDELKSQNVPVKADRDQAWRDYSGWRVNYDTQLLRLARLTMAPVAPWSSDRAPVWTSPTQEKPMRIDMLGEKIKEKHKEKAT